MGKLLGLHKESLGRTLCVSIVFIRIVQQIGRTASFCACLIMVVLTKPGQAMCTQTSVWMSCTHSDTPSSNPLKSARTYGACWELKGLFKGRPQRGSAFEQWLVRKPTSYNILRSAYRDTGLCASVRDERCEAASPQAGGSPRSRAQQILTRSKQRCQPLLYTQSCLFLEFDTCIHWLRQR